MVVSRAHETLQYKRYVLTLFFVTLRYQLTKSITSLYLTIPVNAISRSNDYSLRGEETAGYALVNWINGRVQP